MCGHAAENKRRVEEERHNEGVEDTVVALSYTVPHPRAVMVVALCGRRAQQESNNSTLWYSFYNLITF